MGSMLAFWRLLCCAHPQDNAAKISLVLHTPWTLAADTEAVTQAVQLPHPSPGTPIQREYQISGHGVGPDVLRRHPVHGVQALDRLPITITLGLRIGRAKSK
jgi:hypothetical protein